MRNASFFTMHFSTDNTCIVFVTFLLYVAIHWHKNCLSLTLLFTLKKKTRKIPNLLNVFSFYSTEIMAENTDVIIKIM